MALMARAKVLLLLLLGVVNGPWLFLPSSRSSVVARMAKGDEESRLDPVAGEGELPPWLMEATGGVPKERRTEGVDFSWDYRAVGAVVFALGLLWVGLQGFPAVLGSDSRLVAWVTMDLEERVRRLEEMAEAASSWEGSNVMKFLKSLQGEVSTLRRGLPMSEEVLALREAMSGLQGTVELVRSKTNAMERSLREVNGHIDSSHSSLIDKQTRMECAMGHSIGTELPAIRSDLKGLERDLRLKQDSWLKEAGHKLQAMQSMPGLLSKLESDFQHRSKTIEASIEAKFSKMESRWGEKCSCFVVEITRLVQSKLDTKLDVALWEELKIDMEASVATLREVLRTQRLALEGDLRSLRSAVDFRGDEIRALNRELRKLLVRGVEASVEADGVDARR